MEHNLPEIYKLHLISVLFLVSVDANKAERAKKIHLKCSKLFLEALLENEKICSDTRVWFDCYKTENENGCNAKLIDRYAKFVGKVKERLERSCSRVEL